MVPSQGLSRYISAFDMKMNIYSNTLAELVVHEGIVSLLLWYLNTFTNAHAFHSQVLECQAWAYTKTLELEPGLPRIPCRISYRPNFLGSQ